VAVELAIDHDTTGCPVRTYEVDDARGGGLVTDEEKTLAGLSSPSNVGLGNLSRLLSLLVGRQSLGLNGLGAEPEELLAGNDVPAGGLLETFRL
jgi:hypothetical protein